MLLYFFATYAVLVISFNLPFLIQQYKLTSSASGVMISLFFLAIMLPGLAVDRVIALLGKVFMRESAYCPFETVERILTEIPASVKNIIVDFHAEATSEKLAMGYFLDGKVTAVLGTHTHVPTADARVLPGGTAVQTDVGMVGASVSVLGRDVAAVLQKFTIGMPNRLPVVESGPIRVDAAVVTYDYLTGRASAIESISREIVI